MTNSIDKRIERLRAKQAETNAARQETDRRAREVKRAKLVAWDARALRAADKTRREHERLIRWHKRYFMIYGQWHPEAMKVIICTRRLETMLRAEAKRQCKGGEKPRAWRE